MMSQKPTSPNRQKILSAVILIILITVVWQVIGMFSGKKATNPPAANHNSMTAAAPKAPAATPAPAPAQTPPAEKTASTPPATDTSTMQQTPAPATPSPQANATPAPAPKENEFVKTQQEIQQRYLDSLNELQMLRMKKEIAETNQAIATAKLATVTAEKNISDVLTQPSIPTVPVLPNNEVNPAQVVTSQVQYAVISVAMQNAKWTAVIEYQGKLYSVSVGDILPPDGSVVANINRDGVVLEKNGEQTKINIVSSQI